MLALGRPGEGADSTEARLKPCFLLNVFGVLSFLSGFTLGILNLVLDLFVVSFSAVVLLVGLFILLVVLVGASVVSWS